MLRRGNRPRLQSYQSGGVQWRTSFPRWVVLLQRHQILPGSIAATKVPSTAMHLGRSPRYAFSAATGCAQSPQGPPRCALPLQ
eukprot:2199902-Lingulodinium_polyedra.AAC.1